MKRSVARVLPLVVVVTAGCMTRSEGKRLLEQSAAHERRIAEIEESLEGDRARVAEAVERAQAKVTELQEVLEQATAVVTRNSADVTAEVQTLREQLQALEGSLAELRNELGATGRQIQEQATQLDQRIEHFARRAGVDLAVDPSQVPAEMPAHYTAAEQAFQAGEHSRARALFREYVQRYPRDGKADDAQHWIGRSYLAEERPANALSAFQKVLSDYPQSDVGDATLFYMSEAFYKLHACTDARSALEALTQTYRRSRYVRDAQRKIQEIRRAPRGYCTS